MFDYLKNVLLFKGWISKWKKGEVPYYPVNNEKNNALYQKYKDIKNNKTIFVGRLGEYKYYDMDDTIEKALNIPISVHGRIYMDGLK